MSTEDGNEIATQCETLEASEECTQNTLLEDNTIQIIVENSESAPWCDQEPSSTNTEASGSCSPKKVQSNGDQQDGKHHEEHGIGPVPGASAPTHKDKAVDIPAVQVCVRMRPVLEWERSEGHECAAVKLKDGSGGTVSVRAVDDLNKVKSFRFDAVIGPERSQQDVWDTTQLSTLVDKVFEGFHATVFAYGQTGSGKTFTMEGFTYDHHNGAAAPSAAAAKPRARPKSTDPEKLGLVPRTLEALYARAQALRSEVADSAGDDVSIKVSFLQIYNERIFDLLNPQMSTSRDVAKNDDCTGLRLRWDAPKHQFYVENLFEYECSTAEDVMKYYMAGVQNKHVASTAMNVASSRSHTILVLRIVRRTSLCKKIPGGGNSPVREVISRLTLVDLAGSERASASTGCEKSAARFQEAVNVNQSLFVLRKVITALSKKQEGQAIDGHVPYRESKLTSLLHHALGGNSYLVMLACLSPSDKYVDENISTLHYAAQAASIKNAPSVNVDPKDRIIQQLRAQLAAAHAYILRVCGLAELPAELLDAAVAAQRYPSQTRRSKSLVPVNKTSRGFTEDFSKIDLTAAIDPDRKPATVRAIRCSGQSMPQSSCESTTHATSSVAEAPPSQGVPLDLGSLCRNSVIQTSGLKQLPSTGRRRSRSAERQDKCSSSMPFASSRGMSQRIRQTSPRVSQQPPDARNTRVEQRPQAEQRSQGEQLLLQEGKDLFAAADFMIAAYPMQSSGELASWVPRPPAMINSVCNASVVMSNMRDPSTCKQRRPPSLPPVRGATHKATS